MELKRAAEPTHSETTNKGRTRRVWTRRSALVLSFLLALSIGNVVAADSERSKIVISPRELIDLLDDPQVELMDVRSPQRFAEKHIRRALNAPRELTVDLSIQPTALASSLERLGLDGSEMVVLYGEAGDETRLSTTFFLLESAGFEAVRILVGGLSAWEDLGAPMDRGVRKTTATRFATSPKRATTIDAEGVAAVIGAVGFHILDLRAGEDWEPYQPSPELAAGHVPTAISCDFSRLIADDVDWPSLSEIRSRVAQCGTRPETTVDLEQLFILYGDGPRDRRAAIGYTLLRLLGVEVVVFREGWAGWNADRRLPVVRIITAEQLRSLQRQSGKAAEATYYPKLPIFDLREMRDWEVGHVPGAFPMTDRELSRFLDLVVERYWPGADPSIDPLILYCYGPDCIRSRDGTIVAVRRGWRHIYWFRDGVAGWFQAGYEFER